MAAVSGLGTRSRISPAGQEGCSPCAGLVRMLEHPLGRGEDIQQQNLCDSTTRWGNPSVTFQLWGAPSPPPRAQCPRACQQGQEVDGDTVTTSS